MGHPEVRRFRDLKRHGGRPSAGEVALGGLWSIGHALDAGVDVEAAFVCPSLVRGAATHEAVRRISALGSPVFEVGERVLLRMVDRDGPDGLAAIARVRSWSLDDVVVGASTRLLVADNVELAGNLGTIVRCGDGAGVSAVLLTNRRVRVTHPLVIKASMGTIFTTPVVCGGPEEVHGWLRSQGVSI